MKNSLVELFADKLALPRQARQRLNTLVGSEVMNGLMDAAEQRLLAVRSKLADELANPPKGQAATEAAAVKKIDGIRKAFDAASAAKHAALEDLMHGESEWMGQSLAWGQRAVGIEYELLQSSDPRLQDFLIVLARRDQDVRLALRTEPVAPPPMARAMGERLYWVSNLEEVTHARQVIEECSQRCKVMQLQPVSAKTVLATFEEMIETLRHALAPLYIQPPHLVQGEVVFDQPRR